MEREAMSAAPGLSQQAASPAELSTAELGMIMKSIQMYLSAFPKIDMGDVSTRASRLVTWKTTVLQTLIPCGKTLSEWWRWCLEQAAVAYKVYLSASIRERESILPTQAMPVAWTQIDSWLRPKFLDAVPADVKSWVHQRAMKGQHDETHVLLFWVFKLFSPGSADEKITLEAAVRNPAVCSNARSAHLELSKWKENVRRMAELKLSPPDILLSYRAMESIFSIVLDKAEPQLNLRWISLKNELGLPNYIDQSTMEKVGEFAKYELEALAIAGNSSLNTGLPLTDNQKARNTQIKAAEQEKKRVASAKVKAEAQPRQKVQPPPPQAPC